MEFMDFQLYSLAAAIVFNEIFFPESDPAMGLIMAMGTTVPGMSPASSAPSSSATSRQDGPPHGIIRHDYPHGPGIYLIGFLPTYSEVGIWAPAGLVASASSRA